MNISDLYKFDDIPKQLAGDMIDIKIFISLNPILQGDYVLKDEQSQPVKKSCSCSDILESVSRSSTVTFISHKLMSLLSGSIETTVSSEREVRCHAICSNERMIFR